MNVRYSALASASLMLSITAPGVAQENQAECNEVQFSADLLEKFPNARESCLDVIERDGQEYAVYRARLDRVSGNTAHVRFDRPDGSRGPRTRIDTPPDFRVLINGQPTRLRDVAPNQDLTAYVRVDRPMVALENEQHLLFVVPFVVVPVAAAETGDRTRLAEGETDAAMPSTAGPAPLAAVLGVLFVASALGLSAVRRLKAASRRPTDRASRRPFLPR